MFNIKQQLTAFLSSAENVHWLREVSSHMSFFGSVAAAVFGVPSESPSRVVVIVLWFIGLQAFALALNKTLMELDEGRLKEVAEELKTVVAEVIRDELTRRAPPALPDSKHDEPIRTDEQGGQVVEAAKAPEGSPASLEASNQ